jgi:hypothetical protein
MTILYALIYICIGAAVPLTPTPDDILQRQLTIETNLTGAYEITAQEYKEL